jgi:two-component system sensor histidine kinase PhoQ
LSRFRAAVAFTPSLTARLVVAGALVLTAFLGLTGLILEQAFRVSVEDAVREKLQVQVYLLLGAAELDDEGRLFMPDVLAEPRLSSPASGLYAEIALNGVTTVWQSPSSVGQNPPYPSADSAQEPVFGTTGDGAFYALSYPVIWELSQGGERGLEFRVAESRGVADAQVQVFRRTLWTWFGAVAAALLLAQAGALRWGLKPLRRLAGEIRDIEQGTRSNLGEGYPRELSKVTDNLNALLVSGSARLARYRDALADLAHSLKTPLAVLRSAADDQMSEQQRGLVSEQVGRMDQAVAYHLQRAAAAGRGALSGAVDPRDVLERVGASLGKVYAEKPVRLRLSVGADVVFVGDPGDLTEIAGNLLDNAFKWCHEEVRVKVRSSETEDAGRRRLVVDVEDDGPGIPEPDRRRVLERGARLDELIPGQGIGLALVRELVEHAYGGSLTLDDSQLGGARVRVVL